MDSKVLNQLRTWGASASMPEVHSFYQIRLAEQDRAGVSLISDKQYGPHPRHRMDIYFEDKVGGHGRPVLVFFHGGGFIRGDKSDRSNVGWWGAKQGFLTAVVNYRLAPEVQWPAGGEDVALAWRWLRDNAAHFGGNPHAIVLAGESAGAAHVASARLDQ
jgi:acetyl esterase/lipase